MPRSTDQSQHYPYPPPHYPYQVPHQNERGNSGKKQHKQKKGKSRAEEKAHQIDWPSFLVGVLAGAAGLFVYVVLTRGAA